MKLLDKRTLLHGAFDSSLDCRDRSACKSWTARDGDTKKAETGAALLRRRSESTQRMVFFTKRCESTNDIYFEHMSTEFISSREDGFFFLGEQKKIRANNKKMSNVSWECDRRSYHMSN